MNDSGTELALFHAKRRTIMNRFLIPMLMLLVLLTGCANKAQTGAGLGALAGATIGALTFNNKVSGAAIGAGTGLLLGYIAGNELDKEDRAQLSRTLEHTPSGTSREWRNPDTDMRYTAVPRPARRDHGRIERDVALTATFPDGKTDTVHATAYRAPDGTWRLVQ